MKIKNKKYIRSAHGFLMIDVLFATFVVSVALVGIMAAFGPSIKANKYARKEIIANQLAQEGIELMRAKRDMKLRDQSTAGVFTCVSSTCSYLTAGTYNIDYNLAGSGGPGTDPTCSGTLKVNTEGLFNCQAVSATNIDSGYTRTITVNASNQITSTVTWGNPVKTVTITHTLSSWGQP